MSPQEFATKIKNAPNRGRAVLGVCAHLDGKLTVIEKSIGLTEDHQTKAEAVKMGSLMKRMQNNQMIERLISCVTAAVVRMQIIENRMKPVTPAKAIDDLPLCNHRIAPERNMFVSSCGHELDATSAHAARVQFKTDYKGTACSHCGKAIFSTDWM